MSQSEDQASVTSDASSNATAPQQARNQFDSTATLPTSLITSPDPDSDSSSVEPTESTKNEPPSFEIIVPIIENPEQYDYLPGHFEALRILAVDMHEPKFIVRLKSGERTTVSESNGSAITPHFLDNH